VTVEVDKVEKVHQVQMGLQQLLIQEVVVVVVVVVLVVEVAPVLHGQNRE
jgi:hypothetical protein